MPEIEFFTLEEETTLKVDNCPWCEDRLLEVVHPSIHAARDADKLKGWGRSTGAPRRGSHQPLVAIRCLNCGAQGPVAMYPGNASSFKEHQFALVQTAIDAAEAWNALPR